MLENGKIKEIKKINFLINKKAINFGILLSVIVLVLAVTTLFLLHFSNKKIISSIGTEELSETDTTNLEFYFSEAIKIGVSKSLEEMAKDSFIDRGKNCLLTSENKIFFSDECRPETEFIKKEFLKKVSTYVNQSMFKINPSINEISCKIENFEENSKKTFLRCLSNDIELKASRKTDFFKYDIIKKIKLNDSFILSDKIDINNIENIFKVLKNCKKIDCQEILEDWDFSIEESKNYLIFNLKTKKDFVFEKEIKKIEFSFASKKDM